MITYTSKAFHTHDHLVYKIQILANATWLNLNYIWSLNLNSFSNQLQLKCDKLKLDHINTINIIMCLSIALYLPLIALFAQIDVQLELEATPFVEDFVIETSSARQAAPLFDHADKIPLPSHSL